MIDLLDAGMTAMLAIAYDTRMTTRHALFTHARQADRQISS
jgi:hypothetical protein